MTKASAVMIMLTEPVETVPAAELDAVRRFLTRRVRGLNDDHQRRWFLFLKRLMSGEVQRFFPDIDRCGPFHARHMAIEQRLFAEQDGFPPTKAGERAMRNWLKVGASHVRLELHPGEVKFLEMSLGYDDTSDDEMREFHEAAVAFLRTPRALRKLWPVVKPKDRPAMLEAVLSREKDQP